MAQLEILTFPDPRLRTIAAPVTHFDDRVHKIVDDMVETMYACSGIGLAATQVDIHEQIIVIDISEERNQPKVFINPSIDVLADDTAPYDEGCLSVPGFYETVERPVQVRVSALDKDGKPFNIEPDGLLAICLQHEMDHLNGKLFVDYLSSLKRNRIRTKLLKQAKQRA